MRTGVALGSNQGDRLTNLQSAEKDIAGVPGVAGPISCSSVYETDPVGCEPGAAKFLNAVMEFEYDGDLMALMEGLIAIEESLGRPRDHARNVARIIDIDLLYAGNVTIDHPQLQLPHPRLAARKFVLRPLADVRPELVLPNQTKTVRELLAELDDSSKVVPFKEQW